MDTRRDRRRQYNVAVNSARAQYLTNDHWYRVQDSWRMAVEDVVESAIDAKDPDG